MNYNTNNLVNVMNAIRSYFDLTIYHHCDETILAWLNSHAFSQVQILLIDGMGVYQVENYCEENNFLRSHMFKKVETVYPPTTVAATTSLYTGKYPMETGWLGWQQYFPEIGEHLTMFLNTRYYQRDAYSDQTYTFSKVPYVSMLTEANANKISAIEIFPSFRSDGVQSFEEMCERMLKESKQKTHTLVYSYWDAFDDCLHHYGATSMEGKHLLQSIEEQITALCNKLPNDTGLLILADHGQIDVESMYLESYPDLLECMKTLPSLESRTPSFYIKDGYHKVFEERFQKYFAKDFDLYTKEEAIQSHLFGMGKEHPLFTSFLGDYVASAKTNKNLIYNKTYTVKGNHAGRTKEEMEIPIILYPY